MSRSLVRSELPQWSVKYWCNNLFWWPRIASQSFLSPFTNLNDIAIWCFDDVHGIMTRPGSRDKFDIDRKTRNVQIHRMVSETFVLEMQREFFADGTLSCGLLEMPWLRDMLIWKYSMQERGVINGWLLPPGFMNSCLLEMY